MKRLMVSIGLLVMLLVVNTVHAAINLIGQGTFQSDLNLSAIAVRDGLAAASADQEKIPMLKFDNLFGTCDENMIQLFLYDPGSDVMDEVKNNCNDIITLGRKNPAQTKIVLAEELPEGTAHINVYDISAGITTTIRTLPVASVDASNNDMAAYFENSGRVIFNDNGELKIMNDDGTNVTLLAFPAAPYKFAAFWISNDRSRIAAVEYRDDGPAYETSHYERLVLINSDGTGRKVIKNAFLGEWNMLQFNPDSSQVMFYHHTFNGLPEGGGHLELPQYVLIDIPGGIEKDLCPSALCEDENIFFYTKYEYFLSLTHRELYCTDGTMIADFKSIMPLFGSVFFGGDSLRNIYFADLPDGGNFRRFDFPLPDSDSDGDCILSDGDSSGTPGDNPCTGGDTVDCDDNCADTLNPDQADSDDDGIGDVCDSANYHTYDNSPEDWVIGDFELLNAIDDWAAGFLGDFELLNLIDFWAAGCYHWDAVSNSHEAGCSEITIDVALYANFNGRWDYQWTENEVVDTWAVEVSGTTTKNGESVYLLQEYDPNGYPNDQHFYLTDMSQGLFYSGGANNVPDSTPEEFFYQPDMPDLLSVFVPGQGYSYNFTRTDFVGTLSWTLKIEAETVTVPAGTYTDCYKSTVTLSMGTEVRNPMTKWYAKNVGLVKRIQSNGSLWELTSYTP